MKKLAKRIELTEGLEKRLILPCDGWQSSSCCGANILHTDICTDCKEHCDTQCSDCDIAEECDQCRTV